MSQRQHDKFDFSYEHARRDFVAVEPPVAKYLRLIPSKAAFVHGIGISKGSCFSSRCPLPLNKREKPSSVPPTKLHFGDHRRSLSFAADDEMSSGACRLLLLADRVRIRCLDLLKAGPL
uniref:Uncharacterized protein n=1 Tax=Rhizobium leguminosarum TaxID=384 RepID=A0A179BG02_RHILE|nr:hypothetical protein A4U53_31065 [Rhizobium leguminosarum]